MLVLGVGQRCEILLIIACARRLYWDMGYSCSWLSGGYDHGGGWITLGLVIQFGALPASVGLGVRGARAHQDKPWEGWGWVSIRYDTLCNDRGDTINFRRCNRVNVCSYSEQ